MLHSADLIIPNTQFVSFFELLLTAIAFTNLHTTMLIFFFVLLMIRQWFIILRVKVRLFFPLYIMLFYLQQTSSATLSLTYSDS